MEARHRPSSYRQHRPQVNIRPRALRATLKEADMPFEIMETTVAGIHAAYNARTISCAELVQVYLDRIAALDRDGPGLNSIVTINPDALADAVRLDQALAGDAERRGPLHGIPVVVKDQIETAGIRTTFGSVAMTDYVPATDATVISKLRDAGAVILAKTTMPDFATSWFAYSSESGNTRNPYALAHDPGGSSSGTGAAVAANLGAIGVGEDTGGSIRLPASCNNLVGLKVTPGLISRHGMSPLVVFQDSAGPMCRSVSDCARLLQVMVGFDPADPYTATAHIVGAVDYLAALKPGAMAGKTLGVLREAFGDNADPRAAAVNERIENALERMRGAGAHTVDVALPDLAHYLDYTSLYVAHSRHDIDAFLAARARAPMRSVADIHAAGKYHPQLDLFELIVDGPDDPCSTPEYYARYAAREQFQREIINTMARAGADALLFPTIQVPPPSRAELDAGAWTTLGFPTNTLIGSQAWMPAISVPAGFTADGLPVGLEILGLPYGEAHLLALAYAFEQLTHHRRPPAACA